MEKRLCNKMPSLRKHLKLDKKLGLDTNITKQLHTNMDKGARDYGSIHRVFAGGKEHHAIKDLNNFRRLPYTVRLSFLGHLILDTAYKTDMSPRKPSIVFPCENLEEFSRVIQYFDVQLNKQLFPPRNYTETMKLKHELKEAKKLPKKARVKMDTIIRIKTNSSIGVYPCNPVLACMGEEWDDSSIWIEAANNTVNDFVSRYGREKPLSNWSVDRKPYRYLYPVIIGSGKYGK